MLPDKNPQRIKNLFNEIADYYDQINNLISLGLHYLIKYSAVKNLKIEPNSKIIDIACGSGDITKIISENAINCDVFGLDFSEKMLEIAKRKNINAKFINGNVLNIPFKDNEFDYITISFGLRNIESRNLAILEIYRVLKIGGYFMHLDFGEDNFLSKFFDIFVLQISHFLNINADHYKYLINSKKNFPKPNELIKEFEDAGFKLIDKKYFLFKTISCQILQKYSC